MLNVVDIQTALISKLKANTSLPTDIRELGYQGREITYPNVRVGNIFQAPRSNGNCHITTSDVSWIVGTFSEQPSSMEASDIAKLITASLLGHQLKHAAFRTLSIDASGGQPYRWSPQLWRVDIRCMVVAYEI